MVVPAPLQKGDCIGVMSTSCWLDEGDLLSAKSFMEKEGYKVFIHEQATARLNQSAGSAKDKIDAFHDLIANPDIKMIAGSRGGNRALTMLDGIDFDLIRHNPKIIAGYSDLTSLLNAIYRETGMVTYHAPLFREWPKHKNYSQMMGILSNEEKSIPLPGCNIIKGGDAHGVLIGGNLSVLQTLLGTTYMPSAKDAILFLEDIGDHISRYDRMLAHLRVAGLLADLSGIIIGQFTDLQDSDKNPFGFSLEDIIREHTDGLDIPIVMNAPFGHGKDLPTFPIGMPLKLTASDETVTMSF